MKCYIGHFNNHIPLIFEECHFLTHHVFCQFYTWLMMHLLQKSRSLFHVWFLVKKNIAIFFCLEKKFHEWLFKKIVLLIIARKNIVDSLFGHATTNTCFIIFQRTQWAKILKNKKKFLFASNLNATFLENILKRGKKCIYILNVDLSNLVK